MLGELHAVLLPRRRAHRQGVIRPQGNPCHGPRAPDEPKQVPLSFEVTRRCTSMTLVLLLPCGDER